MRVDPQGLPQETETHHMIGWYIEVNLVEGFLLQILTLFNFLKAGGRVDGNIVSKRNPGNWLSADFEEDDDEEDGDDLCVQSTPPQRRGIV